VKLPCSRKSQVTPNALIFIIFNLTFLLHIYSFKDMKNIHRSQRLIITPLKKRIPRNTFKMKFFSLSISKLWILLGSTGYAATSVTYDFEAEALNDNFSDSVVGWSQDSTNPSVFGQTLSLAYIASTNFGTGETNSGHLGSQFANTPDLAPTSVTGTLDFTGIDEAAPRATLNLAIIDDPTDQFVGRDSFSVSLVNRGGESLAEIAFTPTVGNLDTWDIALGVNGAPATTTSGTVTSTSGYQFTMKFGATATSFSYESSFGGPDTLLGNRPTISTSSLSAIAMTHFPIAPAGSSASTLVFDNIVVSVPEPSSVVLFSLGCLSLARRRRS